MLSTFESTNGELSWLIRRVSPPVSPNKPRPTPVAVASSCNADHFDVGRATIIRDGCSANNSTSSRQCVPAAWVRALRSMVALRESAAEAGRLLFGSAPVEFALTVAVVDSYDQAK